jgi:choline-sulfatase
VQSLQGFFNYDDYFDGDSVPVARASYYGLCSFLDAQIGEILQTLEATGAQKNTRILYTSDHGEMLGNHGFWAKSVMYEESAAIPLIAAGPDLPRGKAVDTPVSLIDCYQTIVESVGGTLSAEEAGLPGHSLLRIANGGRPERTILSEYHDGGSITGFFMIRVKQWKYVHYVGYPPQLFDLASDPIEANDLGRSPAHAEIRATCEARLRALLDPDEVNTRAFADQARKIEELGGEEACLNAFDFNYTPVSDAAQA